jgi:hypothetical protein
MGRRGLFGEDFEVVGFGFVAGEDEEDCVEVAFGGLVQREGRVRFSGALFVIHSAALA